MHGRERFIMNKNRNNSNEWQESQNGPISRKFPHNPGIKITYSENKGPITCSGAIVNMDALPEDVSKQIQEMQVRYSMQIQSSL